MKNKTRHPTRKKTQKPTHTHTPISCGTKEKALLQYLKENKERFNIKAYSRLSKTPRTTIYDTLDRLAAKGLITRELANNNITTKGITFLDTSSGVSKGVGKSRRECRENTTLSTHYHKFKLPISDKINFSTSRITELNPLNWYENKLHNLHQIIINFEDAKIFINPKQLIIHLPDMITKNVEEADFKAISRAIEYAKRFISIGVITEGLLVEEGHYARIESALSDFLYTKVDNRYFLDLGEGRKFWIDHSNKREDETNDKAFRERIDTFLYDVSTTDYLVSDIDKLVTSLGFITKIESSRLLKEIRARDKGPGPLTKAKRPEYIG